MMVMMMMMVHGDDGDYDGDDEGHMDVEHNGVADS